MSAHKAIIRLTASDAGPLQVEIYGAADGSPRPPLRDAIPIFEALRAELINASAAAVTTLDEQIAEWKQELAS